MVISHPGGVVNNKEQIYLLMDWFFNFNLPDGSEMLKHNFACVLKTRNVQNRN